MHLTNVIAERRSVKQYDPDHRITDEELKTLFAQVVLSPSSFNLQHWRFVVVRDAEAKEAAKSFAGIRSILHDLYESGIEAGSGK